MKADVAEQLKAEKSVTERTAEYAVVEASQRDREDRRVCSCRSIADQTRRSRKVVEDADTSVTTITVESETVPGCHREGNSDQGVCFECGR